MTDASAAQKEPLPDLTLSQSEGVGNDGGGLSGLNALGPVFGDIGAGPVFGKMSGQGDATVGGLVPAYDGVAPPGTSEFLAKQLDQENRAKLESQTGTKLTVDQGRIIRGNITEATNIINNLGLLEGKRDKGLGPDITDVPKEPPNEHALAVAAMEADENIVNNEKALEDREKVVKAMSDIATILKTANPKLTDKQACDLAQKAIWGALDERHSTVRLVPSKDSTADTPKYSVIDTTAEGKTLDRFAVSLPKPNNIDEDQRGGGNGRGLHGASERRNRDGGGDEHEKPDPAPEPW